MTYTVCFEYYGSIEVEADNEDEAVDKLFDYSDEYLLEYTSGATATGVIDEKGHELRL